MKKDQDILIPHVVLLSVLKALVEPMEALVSQLQKQSYTVAELATSTELDTTRITDLFYEEPGVTKRGQSLHVPSRVFLRVLGRTKEALRKIENE